MLDAVLQLVTSSDLLNCRQINREWNEISSQILRQRADIVLRFSFKDGQFMQSVQYRHCKKLIATVCNSYYQCSSKSLKDLVTCLEKSKHFPFTSFQFDDLANFGNANMTHFLSIWGENILVLNVGINNPVNSVEILRDLLSVKVSNSKALELQFCRYDYNYEEKIQSTPIQLFADSTKFKLPRLQVLCVNNRYRKFRGIIENILATACNLEKFVGYSSNQRNILERCVVVDVEDNITIEDLTMLQCLNKLHCLQNLRICLSEDAITYFGNSSNNVDLKLQSLALSLKPSIRGSEELKSIAITLINRLLHSSKDAMHELSIEPLGSLQGLNIPKMENLKKLELYGFSHRDFAMFPPAFEMADAFPNLKELGNKIINLQRQIEK